LIPNGLKIHLLPRAPHLGQLFLVGQYCVQSLSDLVNVEESH
jgi:hypothetical protein